MKDITDKLFI